MPDKELTRAGFGPRAAAYIIDRALLLIALCVVRLPFGVAALFGANGMTAKSFLFRYSALDVLCWLLAAAYFVLMTYFTGGTLGKKVMRLRVEKEDGSAIGLADTIYRETVGRFLSGILCLGYLLVLADKKKRAFHDYLCDTRVVYDEVAFRARDGKEAPPAAGWTPAEPAERPAPAGEPEAPEAARPAAPAAQTYGYSVPGAAEPTDGETEA